MERRPVKINIEDYPLAFHEFLKDAKIYDSSCSREAKVVFIDKDGGYYLKRAQKGTLSREAQMTRYFHSLKLGAEVVAYESEQEDWFMTHAVKGEDCIFHKYLEEPKRLCEKTAELLRMLHRCGFSGCPVPDKMTGYLETVRKNYEKRNCELDLFSERYQFKNADAAFDMVLKNGKFLKNDTLLHGDYCLPNIMLDDWNFSAFIDLDNAGVGDKHVDIFWGMWTLEFNLKTDAFADRFLDAYGRENIEEELLYTVAAAEVFG